MDAQTSYRRAQPFTTLWVVLPIVLASTLFTQWANRDPHAVEGAAFMVLLFAAILLLLGRLVVELRGHTLLWHYGFVGWPRWSVPLDRIARLERIKACSSAGAGIHGKAANRNYNASIGGPALRLTLDDGRIVTLGTPEPERLQAFIEARRPLRH